MEVDGFWGLSVLPRGDQITVEMEAKALLNATNLAISCCFCKVVLESYCEVILKGTNANLMICTIWGFLV